MSVVYGLADPITSEIRYVGLTTKPLEVRLRQHINDSHNVRNRHLYIWMRTLPEPPLAIVLEQDPQDLIATEIKWIAHYREIGANLVNGTAGGDGIFNPPPEVRKKLSSWQIGRKLTPEHRAKLSAAQRARYARGDYPMVGKTHSQESRDRIRQANLGRKYTWIDGKKVVVRI